MTLSGPSKWSTIKRQKGANDAKRGALFTKLGKEITIAARAGGGDPDANYRLRLAVDKARESNMPADNIKRAIERATGGDKEIEYEEIMYEGYGPGGVALIVETATDNRNRTAAEVRSIFSKAGGQLAGQGSVAWQFEQRGVISVEGGSGDPDDIALAAIDAGATDVDAITLSIAEGTKQNTIDHGVGSIAITIAVVANSVVKTIIAIYSGGWGFGRLVGLCLAIATVVGLGLAVLL